MPRLAIRGGTPVRDMPFHPWPVADRSDVEAVGAAILSGDWSHVDAPNILAFEREFAELQDAAFGVACNGGTTALEIALRSAGIGPGDEVIVPTYTFAATAVAVLQVGAVPVFCDVEEDTFNIDVASAAACVTEHTAAVMPVHYGGRAADMDAVGALAKRSGLKIIEDACHGWGASWRDRGLGSLGDAAGFSFQASKNLTCGDGGFMTTNDPEIADLAGRIRRGGDGEAPGQAVVLPNNYRMSEVQAALLRSQLRRLEEQNRVRMENADHLTQALAEIPGIAVLKRDPDVTKSSVHVYLARFLSEDFEGITRETFIEAMQAEGIPIRAGYKAPLQEYELFAKAPESLPGGHPFTSSAYAGSADYAAMSTPVAARLCSREVLNLFQSVFLGPRSDMDSIIEAVGKIRENAGELSIAAVGAQHGADRYRSASE